MGGHAPSRKRTEVVFLETTVLIRIALLAISLRSKCSYERQRVVESTRWRSWLREQHKTRSQQPLHHTAALQPPKRKSPGLATRALRF
jgi:hypothetical protein